MITGAIILAAGKSKVSNIPLITREITALREVGIDKIVLVVGHEKSEARKKLVHRKVDIVSNPNYEESEMIDSLKIGLDALKNKMDRIIILRADVSFFSEETLEKVLMEKENIVIPIHKGKTGHPICISKYVANIVLNYRGEEGLRGAIGESGIYIKKVEVKDEGVLMKANTKRNYEEAILYEKKQLLAEPLTLNIKLEIKRKKLVLNGKLIDFLIMVDKEGSMNSACKVLKISYSKGWTMVKKAEEQLNVNLIERQVGGRQGGRSQLTLEAYAIIEKYEGLEKEIKEIGEKLFNRAFKEY